MHRHHQKIRGPRVSVWLALLAALAAIHSSPDATRAAESRARVRMVRLLAEVPDSERLALGEVHDLRLRVERGNILLLRRRGDAAALMPIDEIHGGSDSLRFFYYVEHPRFLWLFPGQKEKGIAVVADGGPLQFDSFELRWRAEAGGLGWIYFPNNETSRSMSFSVVSGGTVDEADPMSTKYWVELGPAGTSGF